MKSDEYCKLFYASHYIPIAYYDSRSNCFSVGFSREEDPYLKIKNEFKMSATKKKDDELFSFEEELNKEKNYAHRPLKRGFLFMQKEKNLWTKKKY